MVHIHSSDILNSTLKIVEKKLADHKVDVKQTVKSDSDECIIQLLISAVSCFCCLLIVWKLFKMVEGGAKGAANMASNMDPEQMSKIADMAGSMVQAKGKR